MGEIKDIKITMPYAEYNRLMDKLQQLEKLEEELTDYLIEAMDLETEEILKGNGAADDLRFCYIPADVLCSVIHYSALYDLKNEQLKERLNDKNNQGL